jgi:hypothetical protein
MDEQTRENEIDREIALEFREDIKEKNVLKNSAINGKPSHGGFRTPSDFNPGDRIASEVSTSNYKYNWEDIERVGEKDYNRAQRILLNICSGLTRDEVIKYLDIDSNVYSARINSYYGIKKKPGANSTAYIDRDTRPTEEELHELKNKTNKSKEKHRHKIKQKEQKKLSKKEQQQNEFNEFIDEMESNEQEQKNKMSMEMATIINHYEAIIKDLKSQVEKHEEFPEGMKVKFGGSFEGERLQDRLMKLDSLVEKGVIYDVQVEVTEVGKDMPVGVNSDSVNSDNDETQG